MTDDPSATTGGHARKTLSAARPARGEFATLARRISSWTSKGMVSAIVLVAGLAFGRQVLQWWADEAGVQPVEPVDVLPSDLGDPARQHSLRFGDRPLSMSRQTIGGSRTEALTTLRATCREAIEGSILPDREPGTWEQQLLSSIAQRKCADEKSGQWQLYELEDPFPTVIGTRENGASATGTATNGVARPSRRIVVWGMAVPVGPKSWTLYTFCGTDASGGSMGAAAQIPLPPGCRRSLTVQVAGGGAIMSFQGPCDVERARRCFDSWLRGQAGWKAAGAWRRFGDVWHLHADGAALGAAGSLDVRLRLNQRNELTGLAVLTPPGNLESGGRSE